jgi:enamine deaminase RidA (YjgF/YER057c/UK114 family)
MKATLVAVTLLLAASHILAADPSVRYVKSGDATVAAIVPGSVALLHTGQVLSSNEHPIALAAVLRGIANQFGVDAKQIVKVNVVASTPEVAKEAHAALITCGAPVSVVVGGLPRGRALGIDVVGVSTGRGTTDDSSAHVLPAGPRVYIAGQAEKGSTPAEAAAKTIASLLRTLEFVGSKKTDVVQARCFLTPMSAAPDVTAEFGKVFGDEKLPLVFVEWKSDLPIEVELIAAVPAAPADAPAIEFLTPPGMKASPLFARVVRINRGDVIYTAGLYAEKPGTGEEQVLSVFNQLQDILKRTNGDFKHLAKATYFVSDADASGKLNEIRPKFYDPQRPPAASKAMVPGVGMKDRSFTMDMIGVVARDGSEPTTKP